MNEVSPHQRIQWTCPRRCASCPFRFGRRFDFTPAANTTKAPKVQSDVQLATTDPYPPGVGNARRMRVQPAGTLVIRRNPARPPKFRLPENANDRLHTENTAGNA